MGDVSSFFAYFNNRERSGGIVNQIVGRCADCGKVGFHLLSLPLKTRGAAYPSYKPWLDTTVNVRV